ncbi:hypothetical protein A176_000928 [Myxococcus hansupus]|uniref:Uncharacterized protein n=1 Tax=Pseudomyxococcus hansupus TaxID=1297742 RepID=A0A0H4WKX8_9BACT|nr:hypothetical protein A176_000928 [Myxococcus hansupus]
MTCRPEGNEQRQCESTPCQPHPHLPLPALPPHPPAWSRCVIHRALPNQFAYQRRGREGVPLISRGWRKRSVHRGAVGKGDTLEGERLSCPSVGDDR